jgi:hypothetical protein
MAFLAGLAITTLARKRISRYQSSERYVRQGSCTVIFEEHNDWEDVKKELVLAGQSCLVVIPIRVEEVTPDEAFAYEFATRQWIDLFDGLEHSIQLLVRQLTAIAGVKSELVEALGRIAATRAEDRHVPN